MRAFVRLRTPAGTEHELVHGDVIGRLDTAALHLDDGRVSEAHAMVSLRGGAMRLLALRGAFAVGGQPCNEVELREGLRLTLARGVELVVVEVELPDVVLGLEGAGVSRRALSGVTSVVAGAPPRLVSGWTSRAHAWVWSTGSAWRVRVSGGGEPVLLDVGDEIDVGGQVLRAVAIPLGRAGRSATRHGGGVDAPLRIVANYDTVHVHRDDRVVLTLGGVLARVVSELVALDGPVAWTVLAGEIWPDTDEPSVLRTRLDATLSRIRRKLRAAHVRADLVRTDGAGQVELLRYPHDVIEDRT